MIKSWGTFDEGEMETKCNHCNKLDLLRQDLDQERTLDGNPFHWSSVSIKPKALGKLVKTSFLVRVSRAVQLLKFSAFEFS